MKRLHPIGIFLLVLALPLMVFAQNTINGKVTDANTSRALAGANVFIEGTTMGAAADANGNYTIANVPSGSVTISASVIGYEKARQTINLTGSTTVNFALEASAIELSALEVFASRATRETPVAYTNIEKEDMNLRLASRDIPMVLNTTPSVYATPTGGGAGDARVNVRGFDQRNVAIMINGVPVNDMENAWVYWSNWDGVGDATSSIQMQRGLSAVNLATPSIGGTMNIITDPAANDRGGFFKQEIGEWGFMKTTVGFNTGMIGNKFAFNGTLVKKSGDGFYGATWTDASAFYFGSSYQMNKNNRFEFYALGAPQRHGQNLYMQNIAVYDEDFARDLEDYDEEAIYKVTITGPPDDLDTTITGEFIEFGRDFNQNWSKVSSSYKGKQYWAMYSEKDGEDRYDSGFLNERENFFNKPQVNLNWYHTLNNQMRLSSTVYWSGGHGGGTGTYGSVYTSDANDSLGGDDHKYYYGPSPWYRDWDTTIAMNAADADTFYVDKSAIIKRDKESIGILRNSRNNQWTLGAISKLNYDFGEDLKFTAGVDWRTAEIDHFREVRDLLGGSYFNYDGSEYDVALTTLPGNTFMAIDTTKTMENYQKGLGDKIAYHFTNTVDWLGFFGQAEYKTGPLSAFGMFGWSKIAYTYTNHFKSADTVKVVEPTPTGLDTITIADPNEDKLESNPPAIHTSQFKGGVSYQLSNTVSLFANYGKIQKPPIFDFVVDDYAGVTNANPVAETFKSYEFGMHLTDPRGLLNVTANYYNTVWDDRNINVGVVSGEDEGLVSLRGVDSRHSGFELEAAFQPSSFYRIDFAGSFGKWIYTDDVVGIYRPDMGAAAFDTLTFYIEDIKIGDAPQYQTALAISVFPIKGLTTQLVVKSYANYYANWDPFSRTDEGDRQQSWRIPDYNLLDFHATFDLPISFGSIKLQFFAHVFNLLDEKYIQDALDNSAYNSWDQDHDADDAEVFFGLPKSMNFGLNVRF